MDQCLTCGRMLDNLDDLMSDNCGGNCIQCMANFGDPSAIEYVNNVNLLLQMEDKPSYAM